MKFSDAPLVRLTSLACLLGTVSVIAISSPVSAACPATGAADACEVTSANNGAAPVSSLTAIDSLILRGASNFIFDVVPINAVLAAFEKTDGSTVTLTGVADQDANWVVKAGTLIAQAANNLSNTAAMSTQGAGHFIFNTGNKTIAALANAGEVTLDATNTVLFDVTGGYSGGSAGTPGVINMQVRFNAAGAPINNGSTHDRLTIGGNASGVTSLAVTGLAPSGNPAATVGNGIELIHVAGTSAVDAFRLAGPVLQGGFQYLLNRVGTGGSSAGFYLQSVVREELVANAVALAASRTTLKALAFADQGVSAAEGIGAKLRIWVTAHGGTEQAGGDAGARFNSDYYGVTGGVDTGFTSNIRLGVKGGYGNTTTDLFMPQGTAGLDGDTYFVQLYGQFISGRLFVDGDVGYASTTWDFRQSVLVGTLSETYDGMIGSVGAGYRIEFDEPVTLTLSARVMYDGTSCGDGCFFAGAVEHTSDWFGRLSARLEAPFNDGKLRPYVSVSLTDDFGDGQRVSLGQASTLVDVHGAMFGLNAGLNMEVAPSAHLFIDGGLSQSFQTDAKGYQAQVGLRMTW